MRAWSWRLLVLGLVLPAAPLGAQQWNDPRVLDLVQRGIALRERSQADSTLTSYQARARGFVFFLAQLGEGLSEPPRLVKADQLAVEVYWMAPSRSKQIILGWRDGSWLPTDINYHRDHLGIVTNNFGDRIRIGEGDEVRDVVHPLSPGGPALYDYALRDSLRIQTAEGSLTVYEVAVRPRDFRQPLVVGTLYLDVQSAALVRFRFSFTPPAYLDRQLEDISIVLENSLWEGRYWLPFRQEVEIRRRTTWLDFPARGIIRGRWEIGEYRLNQPMDPSLFAGPAIAGLRAPRNGDTTHFQVPLDSAVAEVAEPLEQQDLDAVRLEIERIAGTRALGGLSSRRLAANSLSDVVHVNRVQGLTLGFGASLAGPDSRFQVRPFVAFGTSDERVTGSLSLSLPIGSTRLELTGYRKVRDLSDLPVITPVFNSITAQEFAKDYGDYVLLDGASFAVRHQAGSRFAVTLAGFYESSHSLKVAATPSTGRYRPNPALGSGDISGARLRLDRTGGGFARRSDLRGWLELEAGQGDADYLRVSAEPELVTRLAGGELALTGYLGWGSRELPAYRSFVMGGRNTLPGERFRIWGGRTLALGRLEWRVEAPFPAIPLGSYASTGRSITVAPFVAAGWSDRAIPGLPWAASDAVQPVAGVAFEWFMRLIRLETGVSLRRGTAGVTVEIQRSWWGIL